LRTLKEVIVMESARDEDYISISTVIEELEKDLINPTVEVKEEKVASGKEAILEILGRAADDHKFLARLADNPEKALKEYNLTSEEHAALASGDIKRIEGWCGQLDKRLSTWIQCRLQQEKW
jgi:hypothetical protein